MVDDKNKQNTEKAESNDERDQDEGNMNNGVIGGDMGTIKSSNDQDETNSARGDTVAANNGSKSEAD